MFLSSKGQAEHSASQGFQSPNIFLCDREHFAEFTCALVRQPWRGLLNLPDITLFIHKVDGYQLFFRVSLRTEHNKACKILCKLSSSILVFTILLSPKVQQLTIPEHVADHKCLFRTNVYTSGKPSDTSLCSTFHPTPGIGSS